jgi:hypothetical protein
MLAGLSINFKVPVKNGNCVELQSEFVCSESDYNLKQFEINLCFFSLKGVSVLI